MSRRQDLNRIAHHLTQSGGSAQALPAKSPHSADSFKNTCHPAFGHPLTSRERGEREGMRGAVMTPFLVLLLLLSAPRSAAQDPTSSAVARFCPTCKHYYPASQRFCAVDGVPLVDAAPK